MGQKLNGLLGGNKEHIVVNNNYTVHYETGILVLLYRLSFPRRLRPEMERYFGIRKSKLSAIISTFVDAFYAMAVHYLDNPTLFAGRIPNYAHLVGQKCGNLVQHVWGFIDGTTCRPLYHQRLLYSGHKRRHGIKFQLVVTPDGLIALLYGPVCALGTVIF